jgi:hypothetical protein
MGCTLDEIKLIIESPTILIFTVLSGKKKLIEEEIGAWRQAGKYSRRRSIFSSLTG